MKQDHPSLETDPPVPPPSPHTGTRQASISSNPWRSAPVRVKLILLLVIAAPGALIPLVDTLTRPSIDLLMPIIRPGLGDNAPKVPDTNSKYGIVLPDPTPAP